MIRLAISVEGQTEEAFVKSVLAPYLYQSSVAATPFLIGRARGGAVGGDVNVARLASEMVGWYYRFDFVTSLVDFYGFRDKGDKTVDDLEKCIGQEIEGKIDYGWDQRRVIPYVQMHEFEGLLFSDVRAFAVVPNVPDDSIAQLASIRSVFPTPEDINDGRDTAPSKRIAKVIPSYGKVADGPEVAEEIGVDAIRRECPRFGDWMRRLESLSSVHSP